MIQNGWSSGYHVLWKCLYRLGVVIWKNYAVHFVLSFKIHSYAPQRARTASAQPTSIHPKESLKKSRDRMGINSATARKTTSRIMKFICKVR